ncbi:MAG TPA: DUF4129 domain-containing protein, partial [Anaerolineales bacterium]|nr:DUF4129 domain-containing protein [Anaerolineales bacterium]
GIPGEDPMFSPLGDVEDVAVAAAQTARRRWGWGLLVIIVGIAALAFAAIRYRIFRPLEDGGDNGEARTVRGWSWWASTPARRAYYSLVRWSRWLGISPGRTATPAEQAEALGSALPSVGPAAQAVAGAYAVERYAERPVEGGREEQDWGRQRLRLARAWLASRGFPLMGPKPIAGLRQRPITRR